MNCPVCERILAPTLSICPSCGAMMNDTVREELQTKITTGAIQKASVADETPKPDCNISPSAKLMPLIVAAPPMRRTETAELTIAKTSPTLVDFQNKNNIVPEWRLQMQNAVQQRIGSAAAATKMAPTTGSVALKPQPAKQIDKVAAEISDPRVASALKRIDDSRKTFLPPAKAWKKSTLQKSSPNIPSPSKPYRIVAGQTAAPATTVARSEPLQFSPQPRPVQLPLAPPRRETNELPKLDSAIEQAFEARSQPIVEETKIEIREPEFAEIKSIRIKAEAIEIETHETSDRVDEIEDLAPFSMRFGAGLFDFIIGGFVTLVLISPLAFMGGNWWTTSGALIFAAVWAIVLFVYMTLMLGFNGKTIGMKLFSLELVDAIENEYPTLHQAAVSSGLFILLIPFAGAGFLTVFFNEENRALHDLLSGTILVREF